MTAMMMMLYVCFDDDGDDDDSCAKPLFLSSLYHQKRSNIRVARNHFSNGFEPLETT